jgi:hypothetical protein
MCLCVRVCVCMYVCDSAAPQAVKEDDQFAEEKALLILTLTKLGEEAGEAGAGSLARTASSSSYSIPVGASPVITAATVGGGAGGGGGGGGSGGGAGGASGGGAGGGSSGL